MQIQTIIGIAASIFTAAALLPQLIKIIKEKKAADISFIMMLVIFIGNTLWAYYGFLKNDLVIVVSNIISAVLNMLLFWFEIKYRKS